MHIYFSFKNKCFQIKKQKKIQKQNEIKKIGGWGQLS